jgi:predicted RecB family nuclease
MKIRVQNIYDLHSPSFCERRLYYRFRGEEEAVPSPFEELIFKLGKRHELAHVNSLGEYLDVTGFPREQQEEKTMKAIGEGVSVIYQGLFIVNERVNGLEIQITGIPDILIKEGGSYIIRDCKLARHAEERRHPEILLQLQAFGYLFEKATGRRPTRLEAFLGDGSLVEVPYDGGTTASDILRQVLDIVSSGEVPYSPVGWSKCQGCGFGGICWAVSVRNGDVALVYGVDQGLARAFRQEGVLTFDDLLSRHDEASLSEVKRPWGRTLRKVGKSARGIILHAQAMKEKRIIPIDGISLPEGPNVVMLDLEGFPPYLDELDKIYLWGMQVYGERPGPFTPAFSPIEADGDRKGWEAFLLNCRQIFEEYGNIHFVHWHHYEKTKIELYIQRYGDPDGTAQRVLDNLFDLLISAREALVLPEPSYSLKVVEGLAGFKRTQDEYGGDWAMAKYIEAVETEDLSVQKEIIDQIVKYNEEDLAATWAVLQWLKGLRP